MTLRGSLRLLQLASGPCRQWPAAASTLPVVQLLEQSRQPAVTGIGKGDHAINLQLPFHSLHGQTSTTAYTTQASQRAEGPPRVAANLGGQQLTFETGTVARLADGSVTVSQGGTVVLVTAVGSHEVDEAADGVPLQVEFREPLYASARIPRNTTRRERGAGSDREVLVARALDRALRPLFPPGYRCKTQVHAMVLSDDGGADPEALALNGASAALALSQVPWGGPLGAVRLARVNGELVVNPTKSQLGGSDLDLLLAVRGPERVVMLEMGGAQVGEDVLGEALLVGLDAAQPVIEAQQELATLAGRGKRVALLAGPSPRAEQEVKEVLEPLLSDVLLRGQSQSKSQRGAALERIRAAGWETLTGTATGQNSEHGSGQSQGGFQLGSSQGITNGQHGTGATASALTYAQYCIAFDSLLSDLMRGLAVGAWGSAAGAGAAAPAPRLDGRGVSEIRPVSITPRWLPAGGPHGSALFSRGETQSLCVATVGVPADGLSTYTPDGAQVSNLILHYSFPPFCTNEIDRLHEPNRREIGHGALALRALAPVMPGPTDGWPWVVRISAETLASHGSSSMAAACGASLAAAAANVPLHNLVAGISIGLLCEKWPKPCGGMAGGPVLGPAGWQWEEDLGRYALLTDIAGTEDALGDMDFKVAGTCEGVTAMQLDTKQPGLPVGVLVSALAAAREARLQLLDLMDSALAQQGRQEGAISAPQQQQQEGQVVGSSAPGPVHEVLQMDKDNVPLLLGERGSALEALQEATRARLVVGLDGQVQIYAPSHQSLAAARAAVHAVEGTDMVEGQVYDARVMSVHDWGAVLLLPNNTRHILHISEVSNNKIRKVSDVLHEGDAIQVKCLGRDVRGLVRLSLRALADRPEAGDRKQPQRSPEEQASTADSQDAPRKPASRHKHSGQARHTTKDRVRPRQ